MKSKITGLDFFFSTIFFVLATSFSAFGQNNKELETLISSYKTYSELPREISYAHLNKTVILKGEILGFTTYIFDKSSKKPSTTATNIYCTISDENNKIIKSKMILANNGFANGSFQIDSLFTSKHYIFKAYTNWMRNFDEQNYYSQTVKIIDSELETPKNAQIITSSLDAQFLPEGGHFIANTKNSVGVIVKDSLGFGVPNISGQVVDAANKILIDFKTNRFGIGKFTFTPNETNSYKVVLNFNGTEQTFPLKKAENKGIALTMNDLENKVALSFRTNNNTLSEIKNKNFTLAIHNGSILKTTEVSFENSSEIFKMISYEDLNPGINIFTLFDENNQPVLERLFFKYDGIEFLTSRNHQILNSRDSITVTIPIKNSKAAMANNFSVSVLPEETKSYNPNNNIISATYLQPYINSKIENASYYFTVINRKKKFELDNLLLTQGWSSYDWNTIFNNPPKALYNYENGISFRANVNGKNRTEYMMYATENNEMKLFELNKDDKGFGAVGLYPMENEEIQFSEVKKNNGIGKPNLYLMFSPSRIPDLNRFENMVLQNEKTTYYSHSGQEILQSSWAKAEVLDEVIVQTDKVISREDKLAISDFGKVKVIDDQIRKSFFFFGDYIRTQGFKVYETMGQLLILNPRPVSFGQGEIVTTAGTLKGTTNTSIKVKPVKVYLDNIPLKNTDMLYKYSMDNIDYITIDKSGTSEGGLGAQGVIKIFTNPLKAQSKMHRNVSQSISVPLTFSSSKKFYAPAYSTYNSNFYKNFGVIDWFPNLKLDADGNIKFTMARPKTEHFKLFLEGTANDGSFISEEKTITVLSDTSN
ncbi:hypothetical protein O4H26_07925 [Aequorivita viscosa]|nr:hypothetical protein [Aequorivita viscosa]